jgi:exodeoxyribonuclease V alpha subunit
MEKTRERSLLEDSIISEIDFHFARLMTRLSGENASELFLAAALASRAVQGGHICLDLSQVAGVSITSGENEWICPDLQPWVEKLTRFDVVGKPGEYRPLILDPPSKLYLYRYWEYENRLADEIVRRAGKKRSPVDPFSFRRMIRTLFGGPSEGEADPLKAAAFIALARGLCIISGGPGTGKTTLIGKILAVYVEQHGSGAPRIALCAPTGKAAARLQEAIKQVKGGLPLEEGIKDAIPTEASTLHRLLAPIPGSPYFRHHPKNPLPKDLVVVDEASMVDVALMSKLLQALPPEASLILLGDKDQLASVEAGAVLGDLCGRGSVNGFSRDLCHEYEAWTGERIPAPAWSSAPEIQDCVVRLSKSYRFGHDSGIGALSRAVNQGDGPMALRLLKSGDFGEIRWQGLPSVAGLPQALRERVLEAFGPYSRVAPLNFFPIFEAFRILSAVRGGPFGVQALNLIVEQILRGENLVDPEKRWYPGRPILINRNDYPLGLFNGDTGVILPDPSAPGLKAFFLSSKGDLKSFQPFRLPEHETVYAMTVHKSQGSEFEKVLLILPEKSTPVLTRELIYTAVTRARAHVEIWGSEEVFLEGVSRRIRRVSGLRDRLWGPLRDSGGTRGTP